MRHWNTKNSSHLNAYTSSYVLNAEKNQIQDNQIVKQKNEVLDNGLKLENTHSINSKFTLKNGYQFNEIATINADEINSPIFYRRIKEVLRIHALIVEAKYNDTISKIYFNAGLRLNYIEQFKKTLLEPRLQFNYSFSKSFFAEILQRPSSLCFSVGNVFFG
jgi:hypothetical protein